MSWTPSLYNQNGLPMPNWAYADMIPLALLKKAFIPMLRVWDSKWSAELGRVMPDMQGDPRGGSHFAWPLIVDPQMISEFYGPYGRTKYITTGAEAEMWNTKLTKAGFMMEPEEFLNEFTPEANFGSSVKMQKLTQICHRAIERRKELELVNYIFGNLTAIKQFSNQNPARLQKYDLSQSTYGMVGETWESDTSDPFKDIDNAVERQIGDEDFTQMFIGKKTAKVLKNHKVILERIKYVRDVSGGTLEAFFGGLANNMQVHVVKAHTYKEHPDNIGRVGTPGFGDLTPEVWNESNKYWFMRESSHEFAFLTPANLGFTFYSRANQLHTGNGLYVYQYTAHEPHMFRMRFERKFAPGVGDFGNAAVFRKTVPQTV